jgi:hypothetical protein
MKFKQVLEQKGIAISELPKMVQKKIEQIEAIGLRLENYKRDAADDESDDIKVIEDQILELDESLVKSLNKFDPEKYKKRLEHLEKVHKRNKKQTEETIKEEIKEEKIDTVEVEKEIEVDINKANRIRENLKGLKESLEIKNIKETLKLSGANDDSLIAESEEESEAEEVEVEELKTEGAAKPKSTLNLILIGVGAFLITWGAVNYFKSRK